MELIPRIIFDVIRRWKGSNVWQRFENLVVDYPKITPIRSQTLRLIYEINYCAVAPNSKV